MSVPMRRFVKPEEIAAAITFFAGEKAGFIKARAGYPATEQAILV
jgi:NAD(P)-dependent dehydrogenase (short-subunit alcohol dehydrogenase family)